MVIPADAARTGDGHATRRTDGYPACDLYRPGHLVHVIQATKAWESDDPVRWGRFEGVDGGRLVVRFLDVTERYRIHRPAEVVGVAAMGDKVRVSERWRIASISRRFEQLLAVCIALPDDPWQSCSVAPHEPRSFDDLGLQAAERGGFMVPGRRLAQLVGLGPAGGEGRAPDGDLGDVS